MLHDYGWARRMLGPSQRYCIGDLARLLGCDRWTARERLLASGLPATLCRFRWLYRGRCYVRRVWAIPAATLAQLLHEDDLRRLGPDGRAAVEADGLGPLRSPAVPAGRRVARRGRGGALVRTGGAVHKSNGRRQRPGPS